MALAPLTVQNISRVFESRANDGFASNLDDASTGKQVVTPDSPMASAVRSTALVVTSI